MPTVTHNFRESLSESHAASDLPFWEEAYRKAFPDMIAMIDHRDDGWHQRAGVDRSITLASSKQLLIDEKVRGRNKATGKVYEDIALEFLSNDKTCAPGWVCKSLLADYIAYAIAPIGRCYVLPVLQLQSAWIKRGDRWKDKYKIISADNGTYRTLSVPVPVPELFAAIGSCLRCEFTPYEM